MEADVDAASVECRKALAIEPGWFPRRNNLALARAMAGDPPGPRRFSLPPEARL